MKRLSSSCGLAAAMFPFSLLRQVEGGPAARGRYDGGAGAVRGKRDGAAPQLVWVVLIF